MEPILMAIGEVIFTVGIVGLGLYFALKEKNS